MNGEFSNLLDVTVGSFGVSLFFPANWRSQALNVISKFGWKCIPNRDPPLRLLPSLLKLLLTPLHAQKVSLMAFLCFTARFQPRHCPLRHILLMISGPAGQPWERPNTSKITRQTWTPLCIQHIVFQTSCSLINTVYAVLRKKILFFFYINLSNWHLVSKTI